MIGRIFTVGGLTLVSRLTGFARDIILAAVLGAGPIADAFFVALRLPNHFRAIFAEGAFNAAFVPAYARIRQQGGADPAKLFADRVFTLLFASQVVLLVVALIFTPAVISLLAPGFAEDPERFALAVELTRITFPYLLLVSLVTLYSGILNALGALRGGGGSAHSAQSVDDGDARGRGVLSDRRATPPPGACSSPAFSKCCWSAGDAWRNGVLAVLRWPKWDEDVKRFFKALVPATIGSAGVQIALFADTIIASFLAAGRACPRSTMPTGSISCRSASSASPWGPCCCRKWRAGSRPATRRRRARAQNRAIELTLLLSIPCVVAFLLVPDLIMRALFMRGKFTEADATAAGQTLAAYALGLLPFVLIRSVTATFLARGDTATPVKASLDRGGGQRCLQDPADGAAGAGGPRACDLDRRLAQSCADHLACRAPTAPRIRCRPAQRDGEAGGCGQRTGARALAGAAAGGQRVRRLGNMARRECARCARRHRWRRLFRDRGCTVRPAVAHDLARSQTAGRAGGGRRLSTDQPRLISLDAPARPAPAKAHAGCRCAAPRSRPYVRSCRLQACE